MNELGSKIAKKRKDLGMTQIDMADRLSVTRQTVSRWEAGTVLPDIDRIGEIADLLGVSCDYLLKDEAQEEDQAVKGIGRLLQQAQGQRVRLTFFEDEGDYDLFNTPCRVLDFEGQWMKVEADLKRKGTIEKLIPLSSVLSVELLKEED